MADLLGREHAILSGLGEVDQTRLADSLRRLLAPFETTPRRGPEA